MDDINWVYLNEKWNISAIMTLTLLKPLYPHRYVNPMETYYISHVAALI